MGNIQKNSFTYVDSKTRKKAEIQRKGVKAISDGRFRYPDFEIYEGRTDESYLRGTKNSKHIEDIDRVMIGHGSIISTYVAGTG